MNKSVVTLIGIAAIGLLPGVAYAGVPCPATSSVGASPSCGSYCPCGGMGMATVGCTVRDCSAAPLPGEIVTVTATSAPPDHCFCPCCAAKVCTTDVNGQCSVQFVHFGGCNGPNCALSFQAEVQGIVLGPSNTITAASPDTDGNCLVNLSDFIFFAGSYMTHVCCFDYECSGTVDLSDFIAFASHYQHQCPP